MSLLCSVQRNLEAFQVEAGGAFPCRSSGSRSNSIGQAGPEVLNQAPPRPLQGPVVHPCAQQSEVGLHGCDAVPQFLRHANCGMQALLQLRCLVPPSSLLSCPQSYSPGS